MSASCYSCGHKIFWTETTKGKKMPMDAEPKPDGTFRLEDRQGENPLAIFVPERERPSEPKLYVSHYATCPQAKDWRKP